MKYSVYWAGGKARKFYEGLSPLVRSRVAEAIQSLADQPRPPGVKKLSGKLTGVWRIRIGDYRLLYDIDDKAGKVVLLNLDHRRQIYR